MPKRRLKGRVASNKMDKTIVVSVETRKKHPLYHKVMSRSKKYKAHDENNDCGVGDLVLIEECKPLSKDKTWALKEIVTRAA